MSNSNSDLLKEVASMEDYNATTALPKRRRDDPPTDDLVPQHQHADATVAYSLPNSVHNATQTATSQVPSPLTTNHTHLSKTHSTAKYTPVTSMSSGASISPLAHVAGSAPGASMAMLTQPTPMYNPTPSSLATDWDLENLLMMQMGYSQYGPNVQFNIAANLVDQQPHQTLDSSTNNLNPWPQAANINRVPLQQAASMQPSGLIDGQENASASPEGFGNPEDLLSLFSDVPMAFRCAPYLYLHRG